ncbi:hypothetical protein [Ralstonia sp. 24A2]|uniref:hypothetical protein n=1 Tax=Ralstonia sp. 24A2 TaxID=3447364 RepID=UPI003F6A099F
MLGMLFGLEAVVNPALYRDLGKLHEMLEAGQPFSAGRRVPRVRNPSMSTGPKGKLSLMVE